MHRDLFDLGLQILILILPKERTFSLLKKKKKKRRRRSGTQWSVFITTYV